jgi:hypothetical protein
MCTVANTGLENSRCSIDNNSSRVSVAPKNSMCAVANAGPEKSRCSIDSNSTSWSVASETEAGNATKADFGHLANSVDVAGSSECKWPEPFWSTDEESDARITLHASEDAGPKLEAKQNAGARSKILIGLHRFGQKRIQRGHSQYPHLKRHPKRYGQPQISWM